MTGDSGMGDRGEVGRLRPAIKTEPGEEDLVGSTTPTPSASSPDKPGARPYPEDEVVCSRSKLEAYFKGLGVPKEKINEILQSKSMPERVRPPSTTGEGSTLAKGRSASAASDSTSSDVIVLDSDEGELFNGEGAEETPSTAMLNASDKKPPLKRPAAATLPDSGLKVVVPKTEPPESTQLNDNPMDEIVNSRQYEGTTDGLPAVRVKVELSEDCPNDATATEPSTMVEEEQRETTLQQASEGSSPPRLPTVEAIAKMLQEHLSKQMSTPSSSRMPTMSPEVSGSAQTMAATPPKRGMTADESSTPNCKRSRMEGFTFNTNTREQRQEGGIKAHHSAVVAVKLNGEFIYSSSGRDVKRHCLKDPSQCIEYHGSTKEVRSLEVCQLKRQPAALYAASADGNLRCYNTGTGVLNGSFPVGAPITCTTLAWNKIYLGLETGWIQVFNVKTKECREHFFLFAVPVHCIATAISGSQKDKFLCAATAGGTVVVCDGSSNSTLWELPSPSVRPLPPCVGINRGVVYVTAPGQMVQLYDLRGGQKQKSIEVKCEAMGIRFCDNYAIICSAGGMMCFYRTRDFTCEVVYYTGGSNVTCIDVNSPMIATGDSEGNLQVVQFDKSKLCACKIQSCNLKFVRQDDLALHLQLEHNMFPAGGFFMPPP